ncbi:MAG: cofactor-independent phosphoglycerate mutase [Clostridia bacterium]|nr:cofactor-independent phosphoglycerate mutase [Clostridia bacterium]
MKYAVILGDGMADYPIASLGGKTPLDVASKPNIDALCIAGETGLVKTVPDTLKPGSDVANLAVMGYDPLKCYTGRSPLEALNMGIAMADDDVAVRCNLVTLSDEPEYEDKTMLDYSAGEISTEEASELIAYIQDNLGSEGRFFKAGVSYRHCMILHHAAIGTCYTPPHDISDKPVKGHLPTGLYGEQMLELMRKSYTLLSNHPVNKRRVAMGKRPANSIWLWGEGTRPALEPFESKWGLKGGVISAVDLVQGIGRGAGMQVIEVQGATGTYETNFIGKAKAAVDALKGGLDYIYVHMEAPDECGHQGDIEHKILSIELIDKIVVKYIKEELDKSGEDYSILIAPDHPTPIALKTHVSDPVPYIIYRKGDCNKGKQYNESNALASGIIYESGEKLAKHFLQGR